METSEWLTIIFSIIGISVGAYISWIFFKTQLLTNFSSLEASIRNFEDNHDFNKNIDEKYTELLDIISEMDRKYEILRKNTEHMINTLSCDKDIFARSDKVLPVQVFNEYLESEKNCLDYVCLCENSKILESAVHRNLKSRLKDNNVRNMNEQKQIKQYRSLAVKNVEIIKHTSSKLSEISQGALQKIMLDVEYGGVFYYIFPQDNEENVIYIFGATVEQPAMDSGVAYREMEAIFDNIKELI